MKIELTAERLRGNRWAVAPSNGHGLSQLGTCGSWPYLWQVQYVNAPDERIALQKATQAQAAYQRWKNTL